MPPRRMNHNAINRLVVDRVAATIAEYEANRANTAGPARAGGVGPVGGNVAPEARGCTYKTFLSCNPHTLSGTEGAAGLSRDLTLWNDYVHFVGLDTANLTPSEEFKKMMTDEYCPRNELQRMEQEFLESDSERG
ncbi:hypothetical protein Tco_0218483 [Tanacetum coccineum]